MRSWIDALQRHAMVLVLGALAAFAATAVVERLVDDGPVAVAGAVVQLAALLAVVVGLVAIFLPSEDAHLEPRTVHPPVSGRWLAMNSPASKVPSHGVRAYGQAYAVDLVHDPDHGELRRPRFAAGSGMRPPSDFPAFGRPVLSPVSGTVVRVRDGARDHRSRNAWWSVGYLLVEGALRELGGAGRVIGNHVVVEAGPGFYALVAHLQRGSACVREGDAVEAGQQLGRCGNSGNSSEPHVHVQLMDRAGAMRAKGLPMRFADVRVDGTEPQDGMPANGQHLVAGMPHGTRGV